MIDQPDPATDSRRMKAILTLTAAIAFASSPLWTSGFGGFSPDSYPNPQNDPPVQPAGYAFSIWGVIYLWLIVSAGFGLVARADDAGWDRVRWPLIVSLVVGTPWISVAQMSPVLATIMIWVMLIAALAAMIRAPKADRWLLSAPLGLYAGWLTAASFVALGLLGAGYGIAMAEIGWAWAGLLGAMVLGIRARATRGQRSSTRTGCPATSARSTLRSASVAAPRNTSACARQNDLSTSCSS